MAGPPRSSRVFVGSSVFALAKLMGGCKMREGGFRDDSSGMRRGERCVNLCHKISRQLRISLNLLLEGIDYLRDLLKCNPPKGIAQFPSALRDVTRDPSRRAKFRSRMHQRSCRYSYQAIDLKIQRRGIKLFV